MSSRSMLPTLDRVCVERSEHELKATKESLLQALSGKKRRATRGQSQRIILYTSWRNRRPGKSPYENEIVELSHE